MYPDFFKRILDIVGAITGLLLLSPVLFLTSILLAAVNGGSPFFLQKRPGKGGRIFRIIKFKTMNDRRDKDGKLLPDYERMHRIGRLVRSLSVDELPQMINVLLGQMSFIGPRPLLVEYLPLYTPQQAIRHTVRPGITGWAQVNGRNAISWEQKFEHDSWYVRHVSLKTDMKIVWMTIRKIIVRDGIDADKNTTMIPFDVYCRQIRGN
ncbi:sugar transferase [Dysgonomonas sp. 25]|uniref:sugar transferase n=1 Tax=Dysgonomonas sp. 25 TaxID=2302933 RepID=UPI0013D44FAF|nr:sugar transferase [Dysgonomonas sp. 25]NDV67940.1 sugar transferase [Dysgonomonas sp. 25]